MNETNTLPKHIRVTVVGETVFVHGLTACGKTTLAMLIKKLLQEALPSAQIQHIETDDKPEFLERLRVHTNESLENVKITIREFTAQREPVVRSDL